MDYAYADWIAASTESRQALAFAGPWAAGCSAWTASIFSSKRTIICPVTSSRRGHRLVVAQVAALALCAMAGELAGLMPLYLWCMRHSSYGHLDAIPAAGGIAVMTATVSLGYFIGSSIPRIAAIPLAVGATFAIFVAMETNAAPSAPIWAADIEAGLVENPMISVFRLAFFGGCTVILGIASAELLRNKRIDGAMTRLPHVLVILLPVVAVGWLANRNPPPTIEHDTHATAVCQRDTDITICVHPARRSMLRPLSIALSSIDTIIAGIGGNISEVDDATAMRQISDPGHVPLQLQGQDRSKWLGMAIDQVVDAVTGTTLCTRSFSAGGAPAQSPSDANSAVALWLARKAGSPGNFLPASQVAERAARRMSALATPSVVKQLRPLFGQIKACKGTLADLPR